MSQTYLHVTSGNGPAECRIALGRLVSTIVGDCEAAGAGAETSWGPAPDQHGPASAILELSGKDCDLERIAATYCGTVKFVFKSPVRKGHERRNWFVGVRRVDDVGAGEPPVIDPSEVRFETLRAGGPGGQHQNVTDSAVRAVHVPTGLACLSRDERSQHRNRQTALRRLQGMLAMLHERGVESQKRKMFESNKALERGNAVLTVRL